EVVNETHFDTLLIATGDATSAVVKATLDAGINVRVVNDAQVAVSLDETVTQNDLQILVNAFAQALGKPAPALSEVAQHGVQQALVRQSDILAHPVFSRIHSETDMLRYLRMLADKDLALDRTMIPLGSCTMKLNATAEMIPVTWKEFSGIHPFAPRDQAEGYQEMITELEQMLATCTGYDAVSLQPNAGSQGEYAGLLAIRAWHKSRGEGHRNICLIPSSAHGTNPATAHM